MRITLICVWKSEKFGVPVTLADLKPGQSASIESIDTHSPGVVRLMVLGLIEGANVRFENSAIGGDPLEISVFGASISVRKQQAINFKIVPIAVHG
jgi:ferrous iron transport protein A